MEDLEEMIYNRRDTAEGRQQLAENRESGTTTRFVGVELTASGVKQGFVGPYDIFSALFVCGPADVAKARLSLAQEDIETLEPSLSAGALGFFRLGGSYWLRTVDGLV